MSSMRSDVSRKHLNLFGRCFNIGLQHAYGILDPQTSRGRVIKNFLTEHELLSHLEGKRFIGVFLLKQDRTAAVVTDFDDGNTRWPLRYYEKAYQIGLNPFIERSKSKGYHVWIFFEQKGVPATEARLLARYILQEIGAPNHIEIFPKQDQLSQNCPYGNFIYLPLCGAFVLKDRTVFVDPANLLKPFADQWAFLKTIRRTSQATLRTILDQHHLLNPTPEPLRPDFSSPTPLTFGLPPCTQRMLIEGVSEMQRSACYRIAVQLKKTGLPQEMTEGILRMWARRNHPSSGRRIITHGEITEQVSWAYKRNCRSCGCEDPAVHPFCNPSCVLFVKSEKKEKETHGTD